jgi:hypothetical protein
LKASLAESKNSVPRHAPALQKEKSMAENNRNSAMKENKVASIQVTEGGHREQGIHKLVRTDQRK